MSSIPKVKIDPQKESTIRISANEEFKKALASLFSENHICVRKIGNALPGTFPYEVIPLVQQHIKRQHANQAREKMKSWLDTNFPNVEPRNTERKFAEMQVRRLLSLLNQEPTRA